MAQKPSTSPAALSTKSGDNWNNALDPTSTARTPGSGSLFIATNADREEVQQGANVIGHGDFQRIILGFTIVAQMVLLCHSNVLALITDPVDHWCKPPRELAGMSVARWKNVGIPADEVGRFSQCRVYVRPGATPNDTETVPCDSWDYDEVEGHRSARSYWNLVCHRSWLLSLGKGVFMSGALIVVPFMGYLADTEGRKPVIIVASFVLMTTAIASCFAEAFPLYLALIFVNSACASTVHILTVILMFEVAPLQYRTFYMGFGTSLGVLFVEMLFVLATAVRIGWFPLQLLVVAPTLLLLSVTFAVHESPMWLLSVSRLKEAEEVIYTAANMNGESRIRTKQAFDRIKFEMNKASVPYSPVAPTALLVPGSLRGRAAAVFVTTFIAMLAYYALTWSHRLGGSSNLVVRVISVAALAPTYLAMYLALNTLGRLQLMLVLFTLLGGVSGLYGIATYAEPHVVAYALAVAAKCLASALISTNYLYMAELFPSSVRSAVMCGAYTCGRVGAVFASVLSLLQEVDREDAGFAVLAVAVFGGLLVVLSLPETTVRGATDLAVPNMDGKHRDLLDVMQTTLAPKRKKRRRGRPMSAALAVLPVKQALSSPKRSFLP
ncbi:solute carrier family 22 member 6-like [Dermacentor albipictus]|uniref:solute carrier family 22 member 6-like n=1 Tax=Dermacentor albipictus TaxID=60249 RepID=UPI0038FCE4CE